MIPVIQRIVVPVDFSEQADAALGYAAALALPLWASVHLVHVIDQADSFQPRSSDSDGQSDLELIRGDCEDELAARAERFKGRCSKVTTEVRSGDPTVEINKAVVDYGANLIVMGTHGRSGFSHLLYGSVAENVIRSARCPVLAVRSNDRMRQAVAVSHRELARI